MTPPEARARLGVDPGATSTEVRRAYLRALKTCKPDQDPVGFMALREAYEVLKARAPWAGHAHATSTAPLRTEGQERPEAVVPRGHALTPWAHLLAPGVASMLGADPDPRTWFLVARSLSLRQRHMAATPLWREAFLLAHAEAHHDPSLWAPGCAQVLAALELGAVVDARALCDAIGAWLEAAGQQAAWAAAPGAPRWRLLVALCALGDAVSREERAALIAAVRTGDWAQAAHTIRVEWRRSPAEAPATWEAIGQRAPLIATLLALPRPGQEPPAPAPSTTTAPRAPSPRLTSGRPPSVSWLAGGALVVLLAIIFAVVVAIADALDRRTAVEPARPAPAAGAP
ncbi:MAG: hypothetical protein ABIO70_31510 [Pseudomonadota bacterium]